jgi:hypothetical protein
LLPFPDAKMAIRFMLQSKGYVERMQNYSRLILTIIDKTPDWKEQRPPI